MRFSRASIAACALPLLVGLASGTLASPQDVDYSADLGDAIGEWNSNLASGAEIQTRIAHRFEDIAAAHRSRWEAAIWASHARTQLGGETPADRLAQMDRAQELLEQAVQRFADAPDRVRSEFHMMQALIHSNRSAAVDDDAERGQLRERAAEEQATAERLNRDNPRAWMFRGFQLIRMDRTPEGRIMLTKALGKFDAYPSDNPLFPDWGRPWIGFWMGGIEKRERQELPTRESEPGASSSQN